MISKKQLILVFVILLAVIGLAGSGCLKNGDDLSNGTDIGTNNNSSNVTQPKATLGFSAQFGTQSIILWDTYPENANPRFYMYVPAKEVEGNDLVLTFNKTVDVSETYDGKIISARPVVSDNVVTVSIADNSAASFQPGNADPTTPSLTVTVADDNKSYDIFILAAAAIDMDIGSNGYLKLTDNEGTYDVKMKDFVAVYIDENVTFEPVPDNGYAVSSFVITTGGNEVYNNSSSQSYTFKPESVTYTVKVTFELIESK
ncbi:hypothetical protein LJC08_02175 [Methanimicrococcus sp. OttesenSCG-928-J09]|nr:hypothetical protein [Methanimicrococcus sp. OttesenSCG-928-J09]